MINQSEITKKQIKEFWEWCGFKRIKCPEIKAEGYWLWDESGVHEVEWHLVIDLNNLFKYAVPNCIQKAGMV